MQDIEPYSYIESIIKKIDSFQAIEDAYNSTIKSSDNPDAIDGNEIREALAIKRFLQSRHIATLIAIDVFMRSIDNKTGHSKPLFLPAETVSVLYLQYEYSKIILDAKRTEEIFGVTEGDNVFEKHFKDFVVKILREISYTTKPDDIQFLVNYPYNIDDIFEAMNENVDSINSIYMLDIALEFLKNKFHEADNEQVKKEISENIKEFDYSLKQLKADTIQVGDLLSKFKAK
jgi:hypothetical protein